MDKHEVIKATAEIGGTWTGTWLGWGVLAVQWLQVLALVLTIVFTVMRIHALWKGRKE
jgi:hypothetical protein